MHTLRSRLVISHLLPILVIIPLMGIALVYLLETRVLLDNFSTEVTGQAKLIADLAGHNTSIWTDPKQAKAFVERLSPLVTARVMLISSQGKMLVSSEPSDTVNTSGVQNLPGLNTALSGQVDTRMSYNRSFSSNVIDVLVPVVNVNGQVIGIIRLTHRLAKELDHFIRLRYLIAGVLAAGLILGASLGWYLALDLSHPLSRVTEAVTRIASGEPLEPLPEQGPQEISQLAHAVNTLVQRLDTLESSRKQLLANLVHELGRPLGALRSAIQALRGGAIEEEDFRQELLAGMEEETSSLQHLLDDLARLYDESLGALELNLQPVALSDWLSGVLVTWRQAAESKRLTFESSIPKGLPTLLIDPARMRQAVGNLLSNAIKYTPPGGVVSIAAGAGKADVTNEPGQIRKEYLWICVTDTGPGIPPAQQDLIFHPFYRGTATRRFPQGMGLGLTITRDLVTAHNGRLTVDSAPGKGSKFTIWIPVEETATGSL